MDISCFKEDEIARLVFDWRADFSVVETFHVISSHFECGLGYLLGGFYFFNEFRSRRVSVLQFLCIARVWLLSII